MTKAMTNDEILAQLRSICLALPDSHETLTWGEPHFRVGEKIFAGFGVEKGKPDIGFKLEMEHARDRVENDPRFRKATYFGNKGWVTFDPTVAETDENELADLIHESYRLIAPKRSLKKLQEV